MANSIVRLKVEDNGYNRKIQNAKKEILKFAGQLGVATSAMTLFTDALKANIQGAAQFEKSMSSLQSLTGMGAKDMAFFKDAAIELGSTTTQSASQVADAFKLIGSQKPELLKNKDALKQVTKEAITLAEAAGMEVPEAASALTGALNQFGAGADKSKDYINILAAASQKGAGDINFLNAAIVQSGATAKTVGLQFNEAVAALEAIAKGGFDASTAGTGFRNVLLALEKQTNSQFKPSVVGLGEALKNLKTAGLSATTMMDMFGKQNLAVASTLISNADDFNELKTSITGTNTAYEQAKINTDNLQGSLSNLNSAWEGLNLTINSSNSLLKPSVDLLTSIVTQTTELVKAMDNLTGKTDAVKGFFLDIAERSTHYKEILAVWNAITGKAKEYNDEVERNVQLEETLAKLKEGRKSLGGYLEYAAAISAQESAGAATTPNSGSGDPNTAIIKKLIAEANEATNIFGEMTTSGTQLRDVWAEIMEAPTEWIDEPIDNLKTLQKYMDDYKANIEDTAKANQYAAQTFGMVAGAIASIDNPAAKILGTLGQAIAQVALAYSESLAKDKTSKSNIWSFIAASTAATISMVSTISSIKSNARFADGGIVPGNKFSGDQTPILANAGEVVLNKAQTANLASRLQQGAGGGGNAQPYVSGEQIWLGVNNYLKRSGRGEIVTSR